MALRFIDSFEHYPTANVASKYEGGTFGNANITSSGRFGNGLYLNGVDSRYVYKLFSAQTTWIVGFAFILTQVGNNDTALCQLMDSGTRQLELCYGSGFLHVRRSGTTIASGTTPVVFSTWYHAQLKATIGNSAPYEVMLNGLSEISGTGDTQNTANAYANQIAIGGSAGAFTMNANFDDLYICDATGGANDDFLGDCRVECLYPNGNGNSSQFDGSDGNSTDNYLLVDDPTTPDGDTTYVQSPDVGDKDTYAFTNMASLTGDVYGVQAVPYARKSDAGSRTMVNVSRLSGTEEDSSAHSMLDTYRYYPSIYEEKPAGGVWTITDVNAAEFGVKVNT